MPVLPLIDLMILVAWTCLVLGGAQKALQFALDWRFRLVGLDPMDFMLISGVSLLFALSLAARVWVKNFEPELLRRQRERKGGYGEVLPDFPDPRAGNGDEAVAPAAGQDRAATG